MLSADLDAATRVLAASQHAVVGVGQVRALTSSRAAFRSCLRSPSWIRVTPLVLRLAGSPTTFPQRCMAAALDAGDGAVVSHLAAAVLWQLPGFEPGQIHVCRIRGRSGRSTVLGTVHEPRLLPAHHCWVLDGIPMTSAARTVFDLAGCLHPLRAERAFDNALSRKIVTLEALRAVAVELLDHGRTGSALMRRLLDERGAGYIPPASGLEACFFALLVAAGLELPERQVDLGGDSWLGRVDYYFRRLRLVVEVDSERHHTSKLDAGSDARRDAALRHAGFQILRITERQLTDRPEEVVALVRRALAAAA